MADARIRITADTASAEAAIAGLTRRLQGIETAVRTVNRSLGSMRTALAGVVSVMAGGGLTTFIDDLQNMQNKLRIATSSQEEFVRATEMVRAIADSTGQSLSAIGDLYAAVSRNAAKLGYDQNQVVTVTNAMATALRASGTSAQGAASVMYQFSQILAKGKVNGDEFTTIMENLGGPVMDLVAKNMGLTTQQLLEYKERGLIGAKDFTDALIRSMGELSAMSGKSSQTIGQSMQRIQNAFGTAILSIDNATGFSAKFAAMANKVASNGENLVPVIKAIGLALGALGLVFAPVITVFGAAAAAALYFADVLGPVLKPVIDAVEAALGGLVKRIYGLGAAIKAALSGENPFEAYDQALKDFEATATTAIPAATREQEALTAATQAAVAATGEHAGALTGITQKYEDILKDLQLELDLSTRSTEEQNIQNKLLQFKKQLQGELTAAQEQELANMLRAIDANKQTLQLRESINAATRSAAMESARAAITDLDLREQQLAVDNARLQVKRDLTAEEDAQIRAAVRQTQEARDLLSIEQARRTLMGQMTKEQAIQRSLSTMSRLDPNGELAKNYRMDEQALQASLDAKLISEAQYQDQLLRLKREYANRSNELYISQLADEKRQRQTAIQAEQQRLGKTEEQARTYAEFMMKTETEKAQFAIQQGAEIFTALGQQNKKAFEAAKAFNIANAIMNTYMAVTKALASYPFPFSLIAAGGALAFGLAQVAQIRSQQYSGRALGGPVMKDKTYMVGENGPELFTPTTNGSITRNGDLGTQPVTVNFTINAVDTAGFDSLLVNRKGVITQIISDAMMEKGQRGI